MANSQVDQSDPYAAIAQPAKPSDPYAAIAKPSASANPAPQPGTGSVAGLPAGQTLPGFPMAPNAIQNSAFNHGRTPQERQALQKEFDKGERTQQFVQHAASDVASMPGAIKQTASDWWNNNSGIAEHASAAGSGIFNAVDAALWSPYNFANEATGAEESFKDPHPIQAFQRLSGGNPELADQLESQGDKGGADWERWGKPAALAAAGEAGGQALKGLGNAVHGERFANSNLTKMIAPGFSNSIDAYEAAPQLRELYRREADAKGMKIGGAFSGDTPTRNNPLGKSPIPETVTGIRNYMDLADSVVDRTHQPIDKVMDVAKKDTVPDTVKNNILDSLRSSQQRAGDFGSGNFHAYDGIIKRVQEAKDFGELNQIKKDANNMMEGVLHGKGPSGMAAAGATEPVMAWKEAGNAIRQNMYPELQRYVAPKGSSGYFDIADAGRLEAKAMDARDGIYKNAHLSGEMNLPDVTQKYLEKVGQGSLYKTHILRRALDLFPSPAGQFNLTMSRGLGDLGQGSVPQLATAQTPQLKLPPPSVTPPVYPGSFNIPTTLPASQEVGNMIVPAAAGEHLGTLHETLPNPNFTPIEGPSHLQQRKELGSTASTIPDSLRGSQSPARVRADEVGMGHRLQPVTADSPAVPNRAITGEPTTTNSRSNFHYLTSPQRLDEGLETVHNNPGTMTTSDPKVAKSAIENMDQYVGSQEFKTLTPEGKKFFEDHLENMKKQMDEYKKWKAKNPVPAPPGKEPQFEVWLNKGQAGAPSNKALFHEYLKNRYWAGKTRQGAQRAITGRSNDFHNNASQSPQQIQEEEERLMRQ